MKKIFLMSLFFFGVTAEAADDLNVNLAKRFGMGLGGGYSFPIWSNKFDDEADGGFMWNLHARYNFTAAHGIQFTYAKHDWSDTDVNANVYDLMYLNRTNPNGRLSPIWGIGAGIADLASINPEDSWKLALRAKAGIEYAFTEDLLASASIDYQYINQMPGERGSLPTGDIHALVPQVNVTYFFGNQGGASAGAGATAAAAASADDDRDGVANAKDKCPDTTQGVTVTDYGCLADEAVTTEVEVYFRTDSAELSDAPKTALDELAFFMEENPKTNVEIQGFTDNTGSPELNKHLSKNRADTVANYLVAQGIEPSRLETAGLGEQSPVGDNSNSTGRAVNRRVMAIITQ